MACRYQTAICVEESSEDPRFRDLCAAHAAILSELLEVDSNASPVTSHQEREEAEVSN
jgi:hypothetical protein